MCHDGADETTVALLMTEIGDARCFSRRSADIGSAGVDPSIDDSEKRRVKNMSATRRSLAYP